VRIDLVLKGIVPANQNFQRGERLNFSKYAYSAKVKKHMYLSKENYLC
jgi:hypothetical protein